MGEKDILRKLNEELEKDINEECQVVYILSRIRKYLELKNLRHEYKYLNFYCNWALHSKIERTEPVADLLKEFVENSDDKFFKFDRLPQELRRFLDNNNLSTKLITDHDNYLRFVNLLVDIYADTPLEFYLNGKKVLTIRQPTHRLTYSVFAVSYDIK